MKKLLSIFLLTFLAFGCGGGGGGGHHKKKVSMVLRILPPETKRVLFQETTSIPEALSKVKIVAKSPSWKREVVLIIERSKISAEGTVTIELPEGEDITITILAYTETERLLFEGSVEVPSLSVTAPPEEPVTVELYKAGEIKDKSGDLASGSPATAPDIYYVKAMAKDSEIDFTVEFANTLSPEDVYSVILGIDLDKNPNTSYKPEEIADIYDKLPPGLDRYVVFSFGDPSKIELLYDGGKDSYNASYLDYKLSFTLPKDALLGSTDLAFGVISYNPTEKFIYDTAPDNGIGSMGYVEKAYICGYVLNYYISTPLAGAVVSLVEAGLSATTDKNGHFMITDISPGTYTLSASVDTYKDYKETIKLGPGDGIVGKEIKMLPSENHAPIITEVIANPSMAQSGTSVELSCEAKDPDNDTLTYTWQFKGEVIGKGKTVSWTAPSVDSDTIFTIDVIASDGKLEDTSSISVTVTPRPLFGSKISGYVKDTNGNPVQAAIELFSVSGRDVFDAKTVSDPNTGYFEIVGIPDGEYYIVVERAGYKKESKKIKIGE